MQVAVRKARAVGWEYAMTETSIVRRRLRVGVLFMLIGAMLTVVRAHPAGAATVCDNETGDVTVDLPGIGSVGVDPTLDPNAGVCTDLYGLGLGQLNLLVTSQDPNPSSLGNTVVLRECNGSGTCLILLSSTGAELGQLVPCNPTTGGGLCLHDTTVYVDGIPVTLSGYTGADASRVDLIPQVKT